MSERYRITITGISGWDLEPLDEHDPPTDPRLETPEGRLEAFKEAVAQGKVAFAPRGRGGFVIQWSAEGIGFGEFTVAMDSTGIHIDDEHMGAEFGEALFRELLK